MIHLKPSKIPTTDAPPKMLRIVAAPITLLIPGAGPPPTRIPMLLLVWFMDTRGPLVCRAMLGRYLSPHYS